MKRAVSILATLVVICTLATSPVLGQPRGAESFTIAGSVPLLVCPGFEAWGALTEQITVTMIEDPSGKPVSLKLAIALEVGVYDWNIRPYTGLQTSSTYVGELLLTDVMLVPQYTGLMQFKVTLPEVGDVTIKTVGLTFVRDGDGWAIVNASEPLRWTIITPMPGLCQALS